MQFASPTALTHGTPRAVHTGGRRWTEPIENSVEHFFTRLGNKLSRKQSIDLNKEPSGDLHHTAALSRSSSDDGARKK